MRSFSRAAAAEEEADTVQANLRRKISLLMEQQERVMK